jgi:hypothetical protein
LVHCPTGQRRGEGGGGFGGRDLGVLLVPPPKAPAAEKPGAIPQAFHMSGYHRWICTHTKPGRTDRNSGGRGVAGHGAAASGGPSSGAKWRLMAGFRSPSAPPRRFAPDPHASTGRSRPGPQPEAAARGGPGGRRMVAPRPGGRARRGIRPIQGIGQERLCPCATRRELEASGDLGRCRGAGATLPAPGRFSSRPDEPLSHGADSPQGAAGTGLLSPLRPEGGTRSLKRPRPRRGIRR